MPKYLDLFAGAGGLSEGFYKAGYTPIAHVEMDPAACYSLKTRASYRWLRANGQLNIYDDYLNEKMTRDEFYNHVPRSVLDSVLNYEISEDTLSEIFYRIDNLLNNQRLSLIIGGPPCQAYSIAGRSRAVNRMVGDKRNFLYKLYAEFLKKYKPEYFVFENVLGLLSAKDEDGTLHFNNMRMLFFQCGYKTDYRILNASDYGVLQNRRRIILIGVRTDVKQGTFCFPNIAKTQNAYVVQDLLSDLPRISAGKGTPLPVETQPYLGKYLFESGIKEYDREPVTFHQARPHTKQDLEIYRIAVKRWNNEHRRLVYSDLPDRLQTHRNTRSFLDRFKVVAADLPCSQTIVAHIARDGHYYIHPDIKQNRSLTPREAARIQTFPDNYYFESNKGLPSRTLAYKQIGNAVPVCLAYRIAAALAQSFGEDDKNE